MVQNKRKGSFRRRTSGSLQYRFTYINEDGIKMNKSVSGKTEEECYEKADAFLSEIRVGMMGVNTNITIPEILYDKIDRDYKKNYTGAQGYKRNRASIIAIENSKLGCIPIRKVKPHHIELYLQSITDYSNHTISKFYYMLKAAFGIAMDSGIIDNNIMESVGIKCPVSSKADKKVRGLTDEEQAKLVDAIDSCESEMEGKSYRLQLLIELYSGMRMGEINALRPSDINFKGGFVHVSRTISVGIDDKAYLKDTTKTLAGERDVPISRMLEPLLKEALDQMKDNPEGLIFYNHTNNSVVSTNTVCAVYRKICEKYDIPYYGQHSLRHTFATRCIEAGVPAIVLKGWLGHTNIHVTLDTYADVFDRLNLGSIAKFEEYMKQVMSEEEEII